MMAYQDKKDERAPVKQSVPVHVLVELAAQAKALDEEWVQRSLLTLSVVDSPGLANALLVRLRVRALIETLDPYPFDIPSEEDFV
jgi:hypothetical protein